MITLNNEFKQYKTMQNQNAKNDIREHIQMEFENTRRNIIRKFDDIEQE